TGLQKLQLDFQATKPLASFQAQWEEWDGTQWTKIPASIEDSDDSFEEMADGKEYLTVGGKLLLKNYLIKDGTIVFINISPLLQKTIAGFEKSWLRCRLLSPIVPATVSQTAAVHDDQLPEITSVNITATMGTRPDKPLPVEAAFTNMVQVDTTKDLFPFGEKPRVGDTLYLANKEAFSEKDSKVTLNINLGSTVVKTGKPELSWEFWDGQMWNSLGQVDPDKTNSAKETNYSDNTKAFTQNGENNQGGLVTFTFPKEPAATIVNGVESFWIRVRIISGNYGEEAHYKLADENDPSKGYAYVDGKPTNGYIIVPATFRPPSV